jgi:hypothetical protein
VYIEMPEIQAKDTVVIGSVKTRGHAERIIESLKTTGFSDDEISVIFPNNKLSDDPKIAVDHKPGSDPADEKPRDNSERLKGLTAGAVSGGVLLGTLGGLIGLASFVIPGLGLVMVAGPIAAALADAAAGGAVGVIAGALMGMRIPEHNAKQYEKTVREGNILISVHTHDAEGLKRAADILTTGGAEDLHQVVEAIAESPTK